MRGPGEVCVVIPAHDAEDVVGRAVASALAQPEAREVIVVDDGSKDATYVRAREADDGTGRLRVLATPQGGPARARNRAIALARSDWICPLDSDDYFLPGRLGCLLAQADDSELVADDLIIAHEGCEGRARLIGGRFALPTHVSFATFVAGNVSRRGQARRELGFIKPLVRRDFLERTGLVYDPRLRLGEDLVLYASALALGARLKVVEACGYVAVVRETSLSARHDAGDLAALLVAVGELESRFRLEPSEAAAVKALRGQIAAKLRHRQVLAAKADSGPLAAAWLLARSPRVGAHAFIRLLADLWDRRRRSSAGSQEARAG